MVAIAVSVIIKLAKVFPLPKGSPVEPGDVPKVLLEPYLLVFTGTFSFPSAKVLCKMGC